jgi:hypothetical protein
LLRRSRIGTLPRHPVALTYPQVIHRTTILLTTAFGLFLPGTLPRRCCPPQPAVLPGAARPSSGLLDPAQCRVFFVIQLARQNGVALVVLWCGGGLMRRGRQMWPLRRTRRRFCRRGAEVSAPREMKRRALPETYHVASTAARIITHAVVTRLAYLVCGGPILR